MAEIKEIRPQPKQEQFLSSPADITVYGGHAGGGKTYALLLEPLRHIYNLLFNAVFIRRSYPDFLLPDGIISICSLIYPHAGLTFKQNPMEWRGDARGKIYMHHLPDSWADFVKAFAGMQTALFLLDQVEQITADQFWFLFTRLRSMAGVRPYVRATCNPDPDSFLVTGAQGWGSGLISWWIDPETGLAIPERCGVIRWFVKRDQEIYWHDTAEGALELARAAGHDVKPDDAKSITFIEAKLADNKILTDRDPAYEANLQLQDYVARQRLIVGNWKVRPSAGLIFNRAWYGDPIDKAPAGGRTVRMWDLAGSENKGDWTAGLKRQRVEDNTGKPKFYELDLIRKQVDSSKIDDLIVDTAEADGPDVEIGLFQDPAQAGKYQVKQLVARLEGYTVNVEGATKRVIEICRPSSAQAEHGNIVLVKGKWNEQYLSEHNNFDGDPKKHDDIIAADAGAMMILSKTGINIMSTNSFPDAERGYNTEMPEERLFNVDNRKY